MSQSSSARLAWHSWRADVAQRLDRPAVAAAMAYVAFTMGWVVAGAVFQSSQMTFFYIAAQALLWTATALATLFALAVATVAVVRGASGWLAYPLALLTVDLVALAVGLALHPYAWLGVTSAPQLPGIMWVHSGFIVSAVLPGAGLYVVASNAKHRARLLRAAEAERATEAERVAQQRLQAELASIDYDLLLTALRRALASRANCPERSDALLAIVADYLRATQQRGGTDPQRIENAFAELRQACTAAPDALEQVSTI